MIDSKEISVVVQGAIDKKNTKNCLNSIRQFLPKAEIILSTWKGSNVDGLDYDVLVENDDPGAVIHDFVYNVYNNTNRQLFSTQEGIKVAKNKYILKLRTDFYLKGNNFLEYWDMFPKFDEQYKCFNHRVLVSTLYSRTHSDLNSSALPFHPSDFFFFGEAEDIKKYFLNTKLLSNNDLAAYDYKYAYKKPYLTPTMRYSPEQYLCLSYFKQFYNIDFDDWTDWNQSNIELSNNLLFSNFIFLGPKESEIYSDKHALALEHESEIAGLITFKLFVKKYIAMFDKDFNERDSYTLKAKYNKHFDKVVPPIKTTYKWLGEVISLFYYAIKVFIRGRNDKF